MLKHPAPWLVLIGSILSTNSLAMDEDSNQNVLEKSFTHALESSALQTYSIYVAMAAAEPPKLLIESITTLEKPSMWRALIIHGFDNGGFTPHDLLWVIREYSQPYMLSKENSAKLFPEMITDNLSGHRAGYLTNLLTEIAVHKESTVSDSYKEKMGSWSHSEYHNVIAVMVERGYLEAFDSIVDHIPSVILRQSCKRREFLKREEESWASFIYKVKSYSMIDWIMRSHPKTPHACLHLDKNQYPNPNYVAAAKVITKKILSDEEARIDGQLFGMMALLSRQGDMPEKTSLNMAAKRVANFDGIDIKAIPPQQLGEISAMFSNNPALANLLDQETKKQLSTEK